MLYSIGEISSAVNISKDTLRYYDEVGVLKPCIVDQDNGYRYYSWEQIETITKILEYKDYGFSLEQIKTLLVCNDNETLRDMLKIQHKHLIKQKERLSEIILKLSKKTEVNNMKNANGIKILSVDDSMFLLNLLKETFEKQGYKSIITGNGEEAIRMYIEEKPQIVTMDIEMPMNGIECLKKIKSIDPDAKIIMLTAHNEEFNRIAAKEAGASDYIVKPFKPEDLLDNIAKILL